MTHLDEHPINRYRGMNPNFVHEVWRKRREAERAAEDESRKVERRVSQELRLARLEAPHERVPSRPVGVQDGKSIIQEVCDKHGACVDAVMATERGTAAVSKVRYTAMAEVLRRRSDYSHGKPARLFGRDISTVKRALRNMGLTGRAAA